MKYEESFEDKLARWTVSELRYELTKENIYGRRKLNRLKQELARRELAMAGQSPDADLVMKVDINWTRLGVIVAFIFGVVGLAIALY